MWKKPQNQSIDLEYRFNDGLQKHGTKKWRSDTNMGTIKGREKPIVISNDYYFEYKTFYDSKKKNGLFKSLVVEIGKE